MEDVVICPNCGEKNSADLRYCEYCQWTLRPLDSERATWQASASANDASGGVVQGAREEAADEDLLAGLERQNQPEDDEIPEWVARIVGIKPQERLPDEEDRDDAWDTPSQPWQGDSLLPEDMTPLQDEGASWSTRLSTETMGEATPGTASEDRTAEESAAPENDEMNDWLRNLDAAPVQMDDTPDQHEAISAASEIPTWVRRLDTVTGAPSQSEPKAETLPEWLREPGSDKAPSPAFFELPPSLGNEAGVTQAEIPDSASGAESEAVWEAEESGTEPRREAPALTQEGPAGVDVDAVFASMQLPDWLASEIPTGPPAAAPAPMPALDEEPIVPVELPSWVQAMRPVESAMPSASYGDEESQSGERGALLGLPGVLPALPGGAAPSSKPKVHSMRLEVTEQQQAHAALLEQILAEEGKPVPMRAAAMVASQRALRWAIGGLLLAVLGAAVVSKSTEFPLPAGIPNETILAIQAVEGLPPDSRVLVAFEYEPATVGEMEASAASLMDHLLLLKHPRLAVISTSPTGAALAERFIGTALADRTYQRDRQYVNLGFLPGGLAGVQAFAQDPTSAVPLGAASDRVWESDVLRGTTRLSDFAAIIVLTDGLESGRVWIEQTASSRGDTSMIMVSSAQAGPMLLPYVDSGQVAGLVAGINGAAGAEMANGGLPGFIRAYWDAYSLGLDTAVILIALGGLWYLWLGIRERRLQPTA